VSRALVLVLAALLALLAACGRGEPQGATAARAPAEAPVPAPDFTLRDLAGGEVALAALRGRPVVIDFWATWCAPCERQVPVLNAFHEKYGDRIPVLGIAIDAGGAAAVGPFVARHALRYRVLLGDVGLAQAYEAFGFPTLFVIGPDGAIHSSHVGVVTPEALESAVADWAG
jgi:thiol-disulfide isomerase/thioredoxin